MKLALLKIQYQLTKIKAVFQLLRMNAPLKTKLRLISVMRQMAKSPFIATANGEYLDRLGLYHGLARQPQERDADYRKRLKTAIAGGKQIE
jgi:hypothetical protein